MKLEHLKLLILEPFSLILYEFSSKFSIISTESYLLKKIILKNHSHKSYFEQLTCSLLQYQTY